MMVWVVGKSGPKHLIDFWMIRQEMQEKVLEEVIPVEVITDEDNY